MVWLRSLLVLSALALAGCIAEERPSRVGGDVVVESEPPAERVEVPPAPPAGPRLVWIRGHWYWNGRGWLWVGGHWSATRPGFQYVAGHWERRGRAWVWLDGRWARP
ncbi:MAG TPA: hypothetical protein VGM56_27945 [Byssovorax sp.]|jgi:hypothetical protein